MKAHMLVVKVAFHELYELDSRALDFKDAITHHLLD